MIRCDSLVYEYPGTRALDGVSFDLAAGTITALVGPNGAGKTTLLRCLAALEEPHSGAIWIDGIEVRDDPRACHARIGYLSDFFGVYEDLSVRKCLRHHAAIHGLPDDAEAGAVARSAARLELNDLLDRRAGSLSRGQRQRLAVAQAIIHDPKVIMLDEPASGLDPEGRWRLSSMIGGLADGGATLIVSSHILSELEDYSTHVMILRDGAIVLNRPLSEAKDEMMTDDGEEQTCVRVELADEDTRLEPVLRGFEGATRVAVHGKSASIFIPASAGPRAALLRTLVEAGLEVVSYTEDQSRVQEIYFATLRGGDGAPGATGPAGTATSTGPASPTPSDPDAGRTGGAS
ncbi:MAG: ABC transporter ATP-binding protein [Bauldia litoralis]